MVDVDEFKKYNDLYGQLEGDVCLRRVAQSLRSALLRQGDFIARYGGEEMVLLLPETEAEEAAMVAERARLGGLGPTNSSRGHRARHGNRQPWGRGLETRA